VNRKIVPTLLYAIVVFSIFNFLTGCKKQPVPDFKEVQKIFRDPGNEYRSSPLLVFNETITRSEIDRMVEDLHDAGFGGFFIHPRPGLVTEYLSEEWLALYDYATIVADKHKMYVWIYDENSYPSGFAGGHVPEDLPESFNQGQGLALEKTAQLPEDITSVFVCLLRENESWSDITEDMQRYAGIKGDYYIYRKTYYGKSNWYGGFSYVDLLLPGVTEKFIEVTMKGYEQQFSNKFGKVVPGVFTDEPNIVTSGGHRWTPDLFEVFKNRWGYDLKLFLPLLSEEAGDWKKVRYQYMETLLQLFIDRWSKPWYEYTDKNNLTWTGHYWEHGWPNMNDGPDNMAMYAWHQMPGIDMLFNQFNETSPQAQFGNIRAVKEVRSVANQMGYKRTLSETYGGGGWEVTFKDLKRLGDWEFVLGVNYMNQHLSHQTLAGARKYDYPPVFTYHSPWWDNYKVLNDYFARLSYLLSEGTQVNHIAVIEPNSTLWRYYSHTGSNPRLMQIGESFQTFVTTLEKNQVEYDLASENIIKDQGKIENGKFFIGQAAYSTIILPPNTENISRHTFSLLQKFIQDGGEMISFSTPDKVDGIDNADLVAMIQSKSVISVDTLSGVVMDLLNARNRVKIRHNKGNLYHQRRRYRDGEVIFLVNSSMEEKTVGELIVPAGSSLYELDAFTGKIYTYPCEKNGIAAFEIDPAGSMLLFMGSTRKKFPVKSDQQVSKPLSSLNKTIIRRGQENAFPVDFCDLVVNNEKFGNIHVSEATDRAFKAHGFAAGNPWNTSVQFRRNIIERDTFLSGGYSATYHFRIDPSIDYSHFRLVTERPHLFTVKVNGVMIMAEKDEWWLDKSFGVYRVGSLLKGGDNVVELSVSPMKILAEIEPVYILGAFGVVPEEKGWSITSPVTELQLGSWKKQRMPFYSWDVQYSKEYDIKEMSGSYILQLGQWTGTVAEVHVNGSKAGIIGFDPYRLDITSHLLQGKNNIAVRVIGSHKNLLGPHYNDPDKGLASPWHWKGIKEPIPGEKYQMIDYGLFDDFEVLH